MESQKIVLKGQYNLAQGKRRRSVAVRLSSRRSLGLRANQEVVREKTLINGQFIFRTKKLAFPFKEMIGFNSVRMEFLRFYYHAYADGFCGVPDTQGVALG